MAPRGLTGGRRVDSAGRVERAQGTGTAEFTMVLVGMCTGRLHRAKRPIAGSSLPRFPVFPCVAQQQQALTLPARCRCQPLLC